MANRSQWSKARQIIFHSIFLLVFCGQVPQSEGYPTVHLPPTACRNMRPMHIGTTPQTSPVPYTIHFSPSNYSGNSIVTVTLRACGLPFKGFMIQARRAQLSGANRFNFIGEFIPSAKTKISCRNNRGIVWRLARSLSHLDSSPQTELTFQWMAPRSTTGHLVFRVTFIQSFDTYWVQTVSDILQDSRRDLNMSTVDAKSMLSPTCSHLANATVGTVNGTVDVTTLPPPINIQRLLPATGCGTTLGCFSQCNETDCNFTVSWRYTTLGVIYTLIAKTIETRPWMAIGFSNDSRTGQDSVSGCQATTIGTIVVLDGETTADEPPRFQQFPETDVTLLTSYLDNGVFTCTIRRPVAASSDGKRFDLNQNYYLTFDTGPVTGMTQPFNETVFYYGPNGFISADTHSVHSTPNIGTLMTAGSTFIKPSGCGSFTGCFHDCNNKRQCSFMVSWTDDGDNAIFTIYSASTLSSPWMAVGWSSDYRMGNDHVIGCASKGATTMSLFNAQTTGRTTPLQFADDAVKLSTSHLSDTLFTCTFIRPKAASADGKRFDINQPYIIFFAHGLVDVNAITVTPLYHGSQRSMTIGKYTVNDRIDSERRVRSAGATVKSMNAHESFVLLLFFFFYNNVFFL